ncbi:MAG: hypothetical protein KF700_11560, partial [Hyphomonadaceae bacterium]|nr:hypothetical protein [Hyphomonadaceae bacterium]
AAAISPAAAIPLLCLLWRLLRLLWRASAALPAVTATAIAAPTAVPLLSLLAAPISAAPFATLPRIAAPFSAIASFVAAAIVALGECGRRRQHTSAHSGQRRDEDFFHSEGSRVRAHTLAAWTLGASA